MSNSVFELSKRLQKSLDSNYNVIDLVTVFDIIKILEGIPITKEQLETTRLAKYINQLRRKTTNEQLARRSKNLLKKWRNMLMPAIAGSATPQASTGPSSGGGLTNGTTAKSVPTTPSKVTMVNHSSIHHNNNNTSDNVITIPDDDDVHEGASGRCDNVRTRASSSKSLKIPTELTNFYLQNKKIFEIGSESSQTTSNPFQTPVTPKQQSNDSRTVVGEERHSTSRNGGSVETTAVSDEDPPKKRRGRKKGSKGIDSLIGTQKLNNHLFSNNSNSGLDSPGLIGQKKVKTTKQLIEDLQIRHLNLKSNFSFPDLSNDDPAVNSNNKVSPPLPFLMSPMSSNQSDSQHTLPAPHSLMIRSAPVTPSSAFTRSQYQQQQQLIDSAKKGKRKRKAELDRIAEVKVERTDTVPLPSGLNFYNKIDEDIWQLKNKLPPIDREALLQQIEQDGSDTVACSCELVECESEEIDNPVPSSSSNPEDPTSAEPTATNQQLHQQQQRLKHKSIFDDDEMSPSSSSLTLNVIDKNNNSEEEGGGGSATVTTSSSTTVQVTAYESVVGGLGVEDGETEKKSYYKFVEDENCLVKKYNEKLDNLVPDYHLTALHQLYIPHINGNWNEFPDLKILESRATDKSTAKAVKRGLKRRRRTSSSSSEEEGAKSSSSHDLIKCLERLQSEEVTDVHSMVPSVNPFFYFCRPAYQEPKKNPLEIGRLVPLRVDYMPFVVPPKDPPPEPVPPAKPPPIAFNPELEKNFNVELQEGVNGEVYDRKEMVKFLEATVRQRVPKFQMANFFYKRTWPEYHNHHQNNSSVDVLNSLYLNRVIEFKRKVRRKRKRRDSVEEESVQEEDFENDLDEFTRFLKKKRSTSHQTTSLRRFFCLNDDNLSETRLQQDSSIWVMDSMLLNLLGTDNSVTRLVPPLLKLDSYFDWPKLKWNFLLDFYRDFYDSIKKGQKKNLRSSAYNNRNLINNNIIKAVPSHGEDMMDEEEDDDEEVEEEDEDSEFSESDEKTVQIIHENNFRLPSFNQLTEENFIGIRQRGLGGVAAEGSRVGVAGAELGGAKVKFDIESFQQRDFVKQCIEHWPQLFRNVHFSPEDGVVTIENIEDAPRWRLVAEFKDLLREICRPDGNSDLNDVGSETLPFTNGGIGDYVAIKREPNLDEEGEKENAHGTTEATAADQTTDLECYLFKEWHETVQLKSYNDELLTILPYVVID